MDRIRDSRVRDTSDVGRYPATQSLSKKVCMVGAFAVGKTSLVRRFVHNIYDEKYLTTVGVKIDRTVIDVPEAKVNVMLWDLVGEDAFTELRIDHLRGASGFLLVADGTRPHTLDTAISLRDRIHRKFGPVPFVLALNKADLSTEWSVAHDRLEALRESGAWTVVRTSARSGDGVPEVFSTLANHMVSR